MSKKRLGIHDVRWECTKRKGTKRCTFHTWEHAGAVDVMHHCPLDGTLAPLKPARGEDLASTLVLA